MLTKFQIIKLKLRDKWIKKYNFGLVAIKDFVLKKKLISYLIK
jgi:hypothetical protein